ncbi:MAG: phage terminase large subunit family protein [Myxococcota bacterium]
MTTTLLPEALPQDVANHLAEVRLQESRRIFAPVEKLSLLEYAEKYRRWPNGAPYRVAEVPHLVEILEAYSDPAVEEITVKKPSQSGATEGLILNGIAYHMDLDPLGMLVVIPSVDEAEKWSKKKLRPMVDNSPRLRGKLEHGARKSSNTILEKAFPGGSLGIIGSNSGRGFRAITVGRVFSDDVNGWDDTAGSGPKNEGDQVTLIRRRTDRIPDRKLVWVSTPTYVDARIDRLYDGMERRGRLHVRCPQCDELQVLRWGGSDESYGMKWESEDVEDDYVEKPGEVLRDGTVHRPSTAYYVCAENGCMIEEEEKETLIREAEYLAEDGRPVRLPGYRKLGYWFSGLDLIMTGSEWPKMVREFLEVVDDPDALRAWYNLVLAESWEDRGETVDPDSLATRLADYGAEVPDGVGIITAFVDVQVNRIELQVQGFGIREESWVLAHYRIYGDPERPEVWQRLEGLRKRSWMHASGRPMHIQIMGVDAGYLPSTVYDYVRGKEGEGVYAFDGQGGKRSYVVQARRRPNQAGVRPWKIAVDTFKDLLFRRLRIQQPGPGYIHFVSRPKEEQPPEGAVVVDLGMDREYFEQAEGEEVKWERSAGQLRRRYVERPGKANEFIDLHVGCLAGLHIIPGVREQLPDLVERARRHPDDDDEKEGKRRKGRKRPKKKRGGWVEGWRK